MLHDTPSVKHLEALIWHTGTLLYARRHGHVACRFDISVRASPLDVVHYTVDPEDPSNGVCLSMQSGSWKGDMLMNQPAPRPADPRASAAEKQR